MDVKPVTDTIKQLYPKVQGIYLFGTFGTQYERPDSDIDIAVLLPHVLSKKVGSLDLSPCALALSEILNRPVDLINLRNVNTVFQMQIIESGRLIDSSDARAVDEFEMLTISYYQKLQEERALIIQDIYNSKRVLNL